MRFISRSLLIIFLVSVSGKLLAYLREMFIAGSFGTSSVTDAFIIARTVPFRLGIMISGLLYMAFLLVFNDYLEKKNEKQAWNLFNTVFFLAIPVFSILAIILAASSRMWIPILAPGFTSEFTNLAVNLTKIMCPLIILSALTALFRTVNASRSRYVIASLSDSASNFVVLLSLILLVPFLQAKGLAFAVLLGAVGAVAAQVPAIPRIKWSCRIDLRHPGLKKLWMYFLPLITFAFFLEIIVWITRVIASQLPEGTISALSFAYVVTQVPIAVLEIVVLSVVYPYITRQASRGNMEELGYRITDITNAILFLLIPVSMLMIVLRVPIVKIVFQRGAFDMAATKITSEALMFYAIGLSAWGCDVLLFKVFYGLRRIKGLFQLVSLRVLVNVVMCIVLAKAFGHKGLALAFSLALLVHFAVSIIFLKRILKSFNVTNILVTFTSVTTASLIIGLLIYLFNTHIAKVDYLASNLKLSITLLIDVASTGVLLIFVGKKLASLGLLWIKNPFRIS